MSTDLTPPGRLPRVLHLTQPVDGGVARVVTDLVRAQLADGMDVAAVCPDSPLAARLRSLGAHVRPWEATRSPGPSLVREVRQLADAIGSVRPDLVHAHSAKAGLAGRLAVRGRIPTVFQPHAWSFEAVGGSTAALALRWERWAARWASRVICVSEAERDTGVDAGIRGRWTVVPNGIDPERFRPAEDTAAVRARLTARHGMDAEAPLVVCVGRLCRQKGRTSCCAPGTPYGGGCPGRGSCWSATVPTRDGCGRRAALRGVRGGRGGRGALVPGSRPRRPSVPLGGDGAGAAGGDGLRAARGGHGRRRGPREPAAGAGLPLPGTAGGPAGAGPDRDRAAARPDAARLLGDRARRHVLSLHDVRHTARAVAGVYRDLLGARPGSGAHPP